MIVETGTPIDALTGGLRVGTVTLIYGPTGCGKTTLLMNMIPKIAEKGFRVIVIDTEGSVEDLPNTELHRVYSLGEQSRKIKDIYKSAAGSGRVFMALDTITGHFHREVLRAPKNLRASVAGDLAGRLVEHITLLRNIVKDGGIGLVTAHLRSPVGQAFKMDLLRKMAKAVREGKYTPTARDFERYMAYDPVQWIGGQGLGMHTHFRFRIYVDEDESRILQVEKWPTLPNWCIRYVISRETGKMRTIGEKFMMDKASLQRLKLLEFKSILDEVAQLDEEIEVEDERQVARESGRTEEVGRGMRAGGLKPPRTPSPEELIRKEKEL